MYLETTRDFFSTTEFHIILLGVSVGFMRMVQADACHSYCSVSETKN